MAVAKLDRLSRDVHFISGLMAHRVPFRAQQWCDLANPRLVAFVGLVAFECHISPVRHLSEIDPSSAVPAFSAQACHRLTDCARPAALIANAKPPMVQCPIVCGEAVMSRPYLSWSTAQLEAEFERAQDSGDKKAVDAVVHELNFRTTTRARALRQTVDQFLGVVRQPNDERQQKAQPCGPWTAP
jgi:hypothetical protein